VAKKFKIDDDVRDVLKSAVFDGNNVKLAGQLERKLYERVNKVLVGAGGKWNKSKQAHVFGDDPREVLGVAVETGEARNLQQESQFFPTPEWIAEKVIELAELHPSHMILEPSAGSGSLLDAVYKRPFAEVPNNGNLVMAVELDSKRCVELKAEFPCARVLCADFLECDDLGIFDRIIMNPPFDKGSDVKHVQHALRMLNTGGRLVAIVGNGPKQQEKLQPLATHWIELPEGSFKKCGTGVRTAIVVIDT
jgi:hypothetical protein